MHNLFSYMGINEENIISFFKKIMSSENIMFTIIWHDNVLKMKGGRMYGAVLDYLDSNGAIFCTGKQMCDLIQKNMITK